MRFLPTSSPRCERPSYDGLDVVLKLSQLVDQRLVIWGAGLDGSAAVERLAPNNQVHLVVDDPETNAAAQALAVRFSVPLSAPTPELLAAQDLIVRAPGVSRYRDDVTRSAHVGVPSSNLAALWMADDHAGCVIGVTGTKGKSTTSHLTHLLLVAAGVSADLGGNIGVPVLELDETSSFHVVEISSYMAADMQRSPDVGVLTNLGEDHLPWHGSIARYQADKLNLFAHDRLRSLVVSGADAPALAATHEHQHRIISGASHDGGSSSGWRVDGPAVRSDGRVVALDGSPLARIHFALDLCAALTAAEVAIRSRLPVAAIERVVADYRTLPSRLEPVAVIDGVEYVDDALASNPFGTCAALAAYPGRSVVLILGGADRGVDLSPLTAAITLHGAPVAVVLFSETVPRFSQVLDHAGITFEVHAGGDVAGAVRLARDLAEPDSVVLFSPAVPTPTALGNYRDRSAAFKSAVASLSPA